MAHSPFDIKKEHGDKLRRSLVRDRAKNRPGTSRMVETGKNVPKGDFKDLRSRKSIERELKRRRTSGKCKRIVI